MIAFWAPFVFGVDGGTSAPVLRGQLTFDALGSDDPTSPSFSRVLHFAGGSSGVTIGRGYDLADLDESILDFELRRAKMSLPQRMILRNAVGLTGTAADTFVNSNAGTFGSINACVQGRLFDIQVAQELNNLAQNFNADLGLLDPILLDVLLDISWFGDINALSRTVVGNLIAGDNLQSAFETISDATLWVDTLGIPNERFLRRKEYMAQSCMKKLCSNPAAVCSFDCEIASVAARFLDLAYTQGGTREDTSTLDHGVILNDIHGLSYRMNSLLTVRDGGFIDLRAAADMILSVSCGTDGTTVSIGFKENVVLEDAYSMFPVDSLVLVLGESNCKNGENSFLIVETVSVSGSNIVHLQGRDSTMLELMTSCSFQVMRVPLSQSNQESRRSLWGLDISGAWNTATNFVKDGVAKGKEITKAAIDKTKELGGAVKDKAKDVIDKTKELVEELDEIWAYDEFAEVPIQKNVPFHESVSFLDGLLMIELSGELEQLILLEEMFVEWTITGGFLAGADIRTGGKLEAKLTPEFKELEETSSDSEMIPGMELKLSDLLKLVPPGEVVTGAIHGAGRLMELLNVDLGLELHAFYNAEYSFSASLPIYLTHTYTMPEAVTHCEVRLIWGPLLPTPIPIVIVDPPKPITPAPYPETYFHIEETDEPYLEATGKFAAGIDPRLVLSITPMFEVALSNQIGPGVEAVARVGTPYPPRDPKEEDDWFPVELTPENCADCHNLYAGLYFYLELFNVTATLDTKDIFSGVIDFYRELQKTSPFSLPDFEFLDTLEENDGKYEHQFEHGAEYKLDFELMRFCGFTPSDPADRDQYRCQCPTWDNQCLARYMDGIGGCTPTEKFCSDTSTCDPASGDCVENPPEPEPTPPEPEPMPTEPEPTPTEPTPTEPEPTPTEPTGDPAYIGCFDDQWQRATDVGLFFDRTVDQCIAACKELEYNYAGIQIGNECYCANEYDKYGPSTECTMTCEGKPCGGIGANSIYNTFANSNTPSMSMSEASYCGCWGGTLQHYVGGGYTDQGCIRTCRHLGFNFAGLQEDGSGLGGACYCDDSGNTSQMEDGCDTGDSTATGNDTMGSTGCDVAVPSKICFGDVNPCHWCGSQANGLFATNTGAICP